MHEPQDTMTTEQRSRLLLLIFRYLDNLLDDAEVVEFNALLREHAEARTLFAAYSQERFVLRDLLQSSHEEVDAESILDELAQIEEQAGEVDLIDLSDEFKRRQRMQLRDRQAEARRMAAIAGQQEDRPAWPKAAAWLGLAAAVLLVAWIGWGRGGTPATHTPGPVVQQDDPTPRPTTTPAPARLLASRQAQWLGEHHPELSGSMSPGVYKLSNGHAQIAMADGTLLIVRGPAEFRIDSASRVTLVRGALSAEVPEVSEVSDEGFSLETPAGLLSGRGAAFGIDAGDGRSVDLLVMAGQLQASLMNGRSVNTLSAGEAGRVLPGQSRLEPIPIPRERFAQSWEQAVRAVEVEGDLAYLYETPRSLRRGAVESDDRFYLLPESRGIELEQALVCDVAEPGLHDRFYPQGGNLPTLSAGQVVDSYLLHYDRVGNPMELAGVRGVIRFDRPVLGIITDDRRLSASDRLFRHSRVLYPNPTDVTRGLEGREHERLNELQDALELSPDRKTLTIRLETSTGLDQLRILVAADAGDATYP
jgi:hypothetical protein